MLRVAARAAAVVLAFAFALAVSAFVYFLIALYDIGRILEAWFFFFLALDLALLLRLIAWSIRSRRLARVAGFTALLSLAIFPIWAVWNWATFLRYPDIPSEDVSVKPCAIGYSMHVMAAPLVREGQIRLLSVDGVAPTAVAIAAGHYPPGRTLELIVIGPPSDNVRKLAAFLLSPAGRDLLASAGFIPVFPSPLSFHLP